jgi:3-methyladenine DNA glycosylase/8-oxoguanine DNA glycosylase
MRTVADIELRGAGGEPVDLRRTLDSHGLTSLRPFELDDETPALTTAVRMRRGAPRVVRVSPGSPGHARLETEGRAPSVAAAAELDAIVRRMLRLDADLSGFYAEAARDPELAWATTGAGRMLRSQTVFEDVVKTICTTNCAWSGTVRMTNALVEHLGERAIGSERRAFPTPAAMAEAGDDFYRDVARAGYRGAYLRRLAADVAEGRLDLEELGDAPPEELADEEVERRLLALPGVGPYAAAHVMMLLGRHSLLVLDSWTRPTYARLNGDEPIADADIVRRFERYGAWAGLAFWLAVTRDWVPETPA